jgi:hypothetical protein
MVKYLKRHFKISYLNLFFILSFYKKSKSKSLLKNFKTKQYTTKIIFIKSQNKHAHAQI